MSSFADGAFGLRASGADIWGQADAFHFVLQPLSGDVTLIARVVSLENTNVWCKAGVMVRETLDPASVNVFMCLSPVGNVAFQWRTKPGFAEECVHGPQSVPPYWVKLTRAGNLFTGYLAPDGPADRRDPPWQKVGERTVEMPKDALVGLAVTSHNDAAATRAVMDHVEVTR
jgi:hypothetical protein